MIMTDITNIDYNNALREIAINGLAMVPEAGWILSGLTGVLWPTSDENVWADIEAKVEALIDQKLADHVQQEVSEDLAGLNAVLDDYLSLALQDEDPTTISSKWQIAQGMFLHDLPHFQSTGYEVLLLPLFAQFANLHLTLLRDGVLNGATWGWTESTVEYTQDQLSQAVVSYVDYANKTYQQGLDDATANAPSNGHACEPFQTVNGFVSSMTLWAMDFANMWKYFDISVYPDPVTVYLDREIYSQALGSADDNKLEMPETPPTDPIKTITVWGWDRIDAVKVDYPEGGGPDGETTTGRMGNGSGGSNEPPHGGVFDLDELGPVTMVKVRSGDIINSMWLKFQDGSMSNQLGGNYNGGATTKCSFPDEILTSIKIMGKSKYYKSADCMVLGFKFNSEQTLSSDILRAMYLAAPRTLSATQVAERLGAQPELVQSAGRWAEVYNWPAKREKHWARINKRMTARRGKHSGRR